MRLHVLSLTLLLATATPALAEPPPAGVDAVLEFAASPAELRSALIAYADSAAGAGDTLGAGEALGYAGESYQREGQLDSAITCHRRSLEILPSPEQLLALTDQLLLRRRPEDLAESLDRLQTAWASSVDAVPAPIVSRLAWAYFQQGRTDTARALFAAIAPRLLLVHPEWRFRLARAAIAGREYRRVADLLLSDAVRTRGTDDDIVGMLEQAGDQLGMTIQLQREVRWRVEDRDRSTADLATKLRGRLVTMRASDSFTVGGLLVPAAPSSRRGAPPLAVVLLDLPDTLAVGDSLVAALHRHGVTTLLLHPRGSGISVGPFCPSPESWFDREAALQARVARDMVEAARWVRSVTPVDTTRCLLAGVLSSTTMAVEAATLDPHIRALLLVSPCPELVDWGTMCARLARLQLPVFFQIGAADYFKTVRITDALYQAGNRSASRVVETRVPGSGLAQFRADPMLARRFLGWMDENLGTPGGGRKR